MMKFKKQIRMGQLRTLGDHVDCSARDFYYSYRRPKVYTGLSPRRWASLLPIVDASEFSCRPIYNGSFNA